MAHNSTDVHRNLPKNYLILRNNYSIGSGLGLGIVFRFSDTHSTTAPLCVLYRTEQNSLYLPNQNIAIMNKNSKYKWQATRRANCPSKLAALVIAISLISVLTCKERKKDRNNISKVHSVSATLYCYSACYCYDKENNFDLFICDV